MDRNCCFFSEAEKDLLRIKNTRTISGVAVVAARYDGTDEKLEKIAVDNIMRIAAGHTFLIILKIITLCTCFQNVKFSE